MSGEFLGLALGVFAGYCARLARMTSVVSRGCYGRLFIPRHNYLLCIKGTG